MQVSWRSKKKKKKKKQKEEATLFTRSLWPFLTIKGTQFCHCWSDLTQFRTHPRFYACHCYLQISWRSNEKQRRYGVHKHIPIVNLWDLSVAIATKVLKQFSENAYASNPPPKIFQFKCVDDDGQRRQPSYKLPRSLRLRWAKKPGRYLAEISYKKWLDIALYQNTVKQCDRCK